jgi:hypothetical protein
VISAAILDFRIFPAKSEEKKDIKKFVSVKIMFSTEIHGQTSDKKTTIILFILTLAIEKIVYSLVYTQNSTKLP